MKLMRIAIDNYKSLKGVDIKPSSLSVLIGPNASGKSNFIDALDFLGQIYNHGLSNAISIKGGYENIAFRRTRRTKAPIFFLIEFVIKRKQASFAPYLKSSINNFRLAHMFSFKSKGAKIKSQFEILSEEMLIYEHGKNNTVDVFEPIFSIKRTKSILNTYFNPDIIDGKEAQDFFKDLFSNKGHLSYAFHDQLLFISDPLISNIFGFRELASISTFRFSFQSCRSSGTPSVNPRLGLLGEGLPSVVDWIKSNYKEKWTLIINSMQDILPDIEDIIIDYTHTKRLSLFFKTANADRPWSSEEVSDGTLQALAIFIAITDPRNKILAIEEIENSIHPWIINVVVNLLRDSSKQKTIIITTHSPVVIDKISPDEAWIVFKVNGETKIKNLTTLNPDIKREWEQGKYTLSAFLDSGLVPQAIPGGVQ
ncbi:AAA family ATPase [Desulfolutivibrio sulfoxidireducens]|uniref:AAA family ATPase n=1 Tax=Desulfolutivibrio sulfoxidireducens TaxID=2773299 RepID=UPI00159DF376|nr:AAA family ATPase [Desulfolutivibrio sulfoxidireducens]QLA18898.1 AAA family ATPase [Desulfolutivibrio sulfoxidireducens]